MKKWKKALLLLMLLCLTAGQCIAVQAASKSAGKYKVTLNKTSYTMKKGASLQLKATKNTLAKKKKVVWASSNNKIAAVSEKGKVKAKKNGKAVITAKLEGTKAKAVCKIVVGTPVQNIKLNKKSVNLEVGGSFRLTSKVSPKKPSNKKVVYKSSRKSVATVSGKGVIKAVSEGKTKITAMAADGTGKSASCTVTVKNNTITVSDVSLNKTNLNLLPGQEERLSALVNPGNAANKELYWSTSDGSVVTVNNGLVKAVGEGTAVVTAKADNGRSADCSVKVSYKNQVGNQAELDLALSSRMVTDIIYTSDSSEKIKISSGIYSSKTLEINAPNAEVSNKGQFQKVTINAIAENTYEEYSNNVIYFNAPKGRVVVGSSGIAAINLNSGKNQSLHVENNGYVRDINVPSKAILNVQGSNSVPVTLGSGAAGSSITASTELQITSKVKWDMVILPGAENTKATVEDDSCIPSVAGVGRIPVRITQDNDVVNITAEMRDDLNIEQKVAVAGNVQEYYLAENSAESQQEIQEQEILDDQESEKHAVRTDSEQAKVYLLPFTSDNSNLNVQNYKDKIAGTEKWTETDASGNFEMEEITIGNYWMIVEKEGYETVVKNVMITSNNSQVYTCSSTILLSTEITDCENAPEISGLVIDSLTGQSVNVSGIQVKLREGCGNVIGEVLQTVQTDEEGRYRFENIPAGVYTVEVLDLRQDLQEDAIRYNSANIDIVAAYGYLETNGYNCQVDQKMYNITGEGRVQFTLTWGTEESGASADIDSHLLGPTADGEGEFHIYYSNESYYADDTRMADLDVDDTDWEGPEHTTIYQETNGMYRFYIRNFTERGVNESEMLAKSSVQVRVTIGESSYTFNCPNQKGNLWYVCDYDSVSHTIIPKNEMSTFLGDEWEIGISEEEYNRLYLERQKSGALDDAKEQREYLLRFSENDARNQWMERITSYENQINDAEDVNTVSRIRSELQQMWDQLNEIFYYPFVRAENLYDHDFDISYQYDEDYEDILSARVLLYCKVLFGNELTDFTAEGMEDQIVSMEEAAENTGYAYVIHVTDTESGLAYDVWVKVLADQAQIELLNSIQECKKLLGQFVETNDVLADLAQLDSVITDVTNEEDYMEADSIICSLINKYQTISSKFFIDNVRAEQGLEDWWDSTVDEEDEEGNWLRTNAVLRLERDEEITDEEILSKLTVEFDKVYDDEGQEEEISYEMVESDNENYSKMIRVTDGKYTKKIYIKITVW